MNLEELFEEFLREKKYLKNISENTEKFYRQAWKAFKTYGNKQITQTDLNKWIIAMGQAEIKPKSRSPNIFIPSFETANSERSILILRYESDSSTALTKM